MSLEAFTWLGCRHVTGGMQDLLADSKRVIGWKLNLGQINVLIIAPTSQSAVSPSGKLCQA